MARTCARSCKTYRMSAGSSPRDLLISLHKIVHGPLTGFHQDLHNSSLTRTSTIPWSRSQDLHTYIYILYIHDYIYICYGPPRLHHETLARFKLVMEGPSRELIRSFYQDLRESAKISNMPQRERSHAHKVTRGLRKPCQNSHCAKTRVIRHAKSAKKVPQAIS